MNTNKSLKHDFISPQVINHSKVTTYNYHLGKYDSKAVQAVVNGSIIKGWREGYTELFGQSGKLGYFPQNGQYCIVDLVNKVVYQDDSIERLVNMRRGFNKYIERIAFKLNPNEENVTVFTMYEDTCRFSDPKRKVGSLEIFYRTEWVKPTHWGFLTPDQSKMYRDGVYPAHLFTIYENFDGE